MPKIKDLGVKVIPQTMQPPEMGPGGGQQCVAPTFNCNCTNGCTNTCGSCTDCTNCTYCSWVTQIANVRGPISREQIGSLKDQLKQQLEALEAYEKTLGPRTAEAIEARQKQLEDELAQLQQRRKDLDTK